MKSRLLTLIAIIMGALIVGALIYLVTQKRSQEEIGSYETGVNYPTSPIALKLWMPSDERDNIEPIILEYNKIHPNVAIVVEYIENAQYQTRLTQAISTNTAPDMFVFRNDGLPLYKKGIATAPSSVIDANKFRSTFAEFSAKKLIIDNSIYGLPLGVATLGQIYNTQRLTDSGITTPAKDWNQFEELNKKLRKLDGANLTESGVALGTTAIRNYPDIVSILMMQNGAVMTNQPPTQATFEQADTTGYYAGAKALAFYASFAQPDKQNYTWNSSYGDSQNALATDKTAINIDYPMAIKQIRKSNPDISIESALLPQVNQTDPINYGVALTGSVSKDSKFVDIAWDFWGFTTSKPAQKIYSLQSYWPASRKDLIEDQKNDKDLGPFVNQISTANDWYKGINFQTNADFVNMLNYYYSGLDAQITVKNASTEVTKSILLSNQ
ncbi:MAG TPA: extracellular solute-binding protein [Candidatus Saccharibacteria bacterium]|nr:extracellular solute-binding protein [Candidatus Saccharibacteria bacterium]